MSGEFEQVAHKMRWASQQLATLGEAITEYVNRRPYVTFINDKPELQGYEVVYRLHEAPPPKLALLAGDFLNNAQGALDYLAWQLVVQPGSQTYFPILLPNEDGTLPTIKIADAKGKPAKLDPAVLDALDAVQPYKDGPHARSHPLFVLKRLNRESKHRELPLLAVTIPSFSMSGFVDLPEQLPMPTNVPKRLQDEEEVKFFTYLKPPNPRMPEKIEIAAGVALEGFEEPIPPSLWDTMVAIHNRLVEDVLPRFQPFF